MPIYERGSTFMASVGSGKDRFRKSFKTRQEAESFLRTENLIRIKLATKTDSGRTAKPQTLRTLGAAYKITIKDVWSQNKSTHYLKSAGAVIRHLGDDMPVSKINSVVIREMVDEFEDAGNAGGTINAKISALSMMLKTAAGEGWIDSIPYMKRRTPGTHRIRWMDGDEEQKVLNTCTQLGLYSLKDFITVDIDTGFRRMELLDFRIADYRNGMLHLHPDQTKTSKARAVPATDRVVEIINERCNNVRLFDDLTPSTLRTQWEMLRDTLGYLEDSQFVVHMLRHTCASRMAMQDKPAQFIQQWMGHASPITTARYMHLAPNKLLEGKAALDDYRKNFKPSFKVV